MSKHRDFYRALFFYTFVVILFLLACETLISCKSKKQSESIQESTVENNFTAVKDVKQINGAVNDSLFVQIGFLKTALKQCDSVCNEALQNELAKINSRKKSGNNETGFYYDKYRNLLVAYSKLEATVNHRKDSIVNKYYAVKTIRKETHTVPADFTKEQSFNLWTGRFFWIGLLVYGGYRIRNKIA